MKAAILLVATLTGLQAQESAQPFAAIRSALSLTDLQLLQLQQSLSTVKPINGLERIGFYSASRLYGVPFHPFVPTGDARKLAILDDVQRGKLAVIAPVLEKDTIAAAAISMNLIETPQWLRGMCPYPPDYYAREFGLTDSQVSQLELLQQPLRALIFYKMKQRTELLRSTGEPAYRHPGMPGRSGAQLSREVMEKNDEIVALMNTAHGAKSPRDLAWNILNKSQQEFFSEFATSLQIATEAIELGLLPPQFRGESLCH